MRDRRADIAVIGGGPAGIAAACRAAESGASVVVLDEGFDLGGQIFRRRVGESAPSRILDWLDRFERSGARHVARASVYDAARDDRGWLVRSETREGVVDVRARSIILATGARELMLPFPGWTTPGVMGAGGAQALLKSGMDVRGLRVVVAGSGPLLLPVATSLAKAGARIGVVAEQAPASEIVAFGARLVLDPAKLSEALRYRSAARRVRFGAWVTAAQGTDHVTTAVVRDRRRASRVPCDLLCTSYGLVPNTELARLVGCDVVEGVVAVDAHQATSVSSVHCAGEPCGIAGADVALVEGEIAGLAAAARFDPTLGEGARLARRRDAGRRYGRALARAFRLRSELASLARPDTIVCRCEDVRCGEIDPTWTQRQAKLYTRVGMGPCQGRVCGAALSLSHGWTDDSVRPPVKPVALGHLLVAKEEAG